VIYRIISEDVLSPKLKANAIEIPPRRPPHVNIATVLSGLLSGCFNKEYGRKTEIKREIKTIKIAILPNIR